jgi:hypothetical protein
MGTLESLWPYFLFGAAVVMAAATIRTHLRGWIKDEDGEVFYRKDHPVPSSSTSCSARRASPS